MINGRMKREIDRSAKQRRLAALVGACLAILAMACSNLGRPGVDLIVLVDISATIPAADSAIYLTSFDAAVKQLKRGDRLTLAKISEQSTGMFRPTAEFKLPNTHVRQNDLDSRDSTLKAARDTLARMLQSRRVDSTNILDAISAASELFARHGSGQARRILVLLTDGLHETAEYNLRTQRVDSAYTERLIADRRGAGRLPSLKDVRIYVAGAGAVDPARYVQVSRLWHRYFEATGAICDSSMYGRSALADVH
jgi:hypothetical protein